MSPKLFAAVCFLACLGGCWAQGVDLTLEEEESGSEVVLAVIAKIEASGIFPTDNRLLRRIAYVETNDGTDPTTYRPDERYYGGIWQVELVDFKHTQNMSKFASLHNKIASSLEITWTDVRWSGLQKPMYSGLAARLLLYESATVETIPAASDISGQAEYWKKYYNESGNVTQFIEDVEALEETEKCEVFFDLIFVLDSSGSVGKENFSMVRTFVHTFVSELAIGPQANQVGMIIFSNCEHIIFNLSSYSNKSALLEAILNQTEYTTGFTNTGDAIRTMAEVGFSKEAGARVDDGTVFRIGIVMTDGMSNRGEPIENVTADVRAFNPPILVYAIGVGSGINQTELELIASEPGFIDYLQSFRADLFQQSQEQRIYEICFRASLPTEVEQTVSGTLDRGQQVRYQLSIPEEGVTISLCVDSGRIVLYTSLTVPNPGPAYYDYKLDCIDCNSPECELYVNPVDTVPMVIMVGRRKRADDNSTAKVFTNLTLYISMVGVETNSTFEIESTVGDTTTPIQPDNDDNDFPWILIGAVAGGELIMIVVVILAVGLCMWRMHNNRRMPSAKKSDSVQVNKRTI